MSPAPAGTTQGGLAARGPDPWIDVTHETWGGGADPTAQTDSTGAFQSIRNFISSLNAAGVQTGAVAFAPIGVYLVTTAMKNLILAGDPTIVTFGAKVTDTNIAAAVAIPSFGFAGAGLAHLGNPVETFTTTKRFAVAPVLGNAVPLKSRNVANTVDVSLIDLNNGDQIIVGDPLNATDVVVRAGGFGDIAFDATFGTGGVFAAPFLMAGTADSVFGKGGFRNPNDVYVAYNGAIQIVSDVGSPVAPFLYLNDLRNGNGRNWVASSGIFNTGHFEITDFSDSAVPAIDIVFPYVMTLGGQLRMRNAQVIQWLNADGVTLGASIVQDAANFVSFLGPSAATNIRFTDHAFTAENLRITDFGDIAIGRAAPGVAATKGFPYIPADAGTPTGVPAGIAGFVPVKYDTTNHKLWIYDGGAWKGAVYA